LCSTKARLPHSAAVSKRFVSCRLVVLSTTGLGLCKRYLDSILYTTEEDALPRKRAILREYLDTQREQDKDGKNTTILPQFIKAWDYAAETNFEALLAQVTANLALLFKVFATSPDFEIYGSLLCKTIMQPSVARRLVRSLSAPTSKEQVILPALRLLIEITKFKEGAFARAVWTRRDFTLEPKILARNIGTWKDAHGQTAMELQRKPSIRTTSVRYLLAHLKYQDERAKVELLSNKDVVRAVLDHLTTDPPFLLAEIFHVFKSHVFTDKTIPRHVKSRILNGRALSHIAALYRYEPLEGALAEGEKTPDELAHDFLCMVCTSPAYGVMLPTQGFYPHAYDDGDDAPTEDFADDDEYLGTDLSAGLQKPARVRNVILADFLQTLRPYANTRHQELVVELFKACPELVHDYFYKKQDFNYEPKLTSTWIGFSAFLYQTIDTPVPQYFGAWKGFRDHAPPVSAALQSMLPQPLTQQVLVKCLNSSSDLISLFAVRVLVVAFQKLRLVLKECDRARAIKPTSSWASIPKRLVNEFSQRCPPMKAVITAFRQPAFQNGLMREAITRLLRLYYEVTPGVALEEKFDVSIPLCNALTQAEKMRESAEDKVFCIMELEHWIQMARHSPAMRWWQKPSEWCDILPLR
jgi:nucleolar pre-ribosomal-associated protein 1